MGLPAVAFTEHADYTTWAVLESGPDADEHLLALSGSDGLFTPPELDLDGHLECLQRCRDKFPGLPIASGVELGEPHWHGVAVAALLRAADFERVPGSLHCLPSGQRFSEMPGLYGSGQRPGSSATTWPRSRTAGRGRC